MKKFIKDPIAVFLSTIGILFVGLSVFLFTSCGNTQRDFEEAQETKTATEVVNHNEKAIVIETLHNKWNNNGVYKVTIDSANTFIVVSNYDAIAIERLK